MRKRKRSKKLIKKGKPSPGGLAHHMEKYAPIERTVPDALRDAFENSNLPLAERIQTFSRYVRRQDLTRFLTRYELFKLALPIHGNVMECGVFTGAGLFSWFHCSSILEPYNYTRRIVGFDTFTGFPSVHAKDTKRGSSSYLHKGGLTTSKDTVRQIYDILKIHDKNRPLGHIPKVELVKGDAGKTIPKYLKSHPSTLISLLYLDFDIYKPTKVALECFYPRVAKGGIVAFDELNCPEFPGETVALLESLDLKQVPLRRFALDPCISYFVKE